MSDLFSLEPEHVGVSAIGAALLLAFWLPRLVFSGAPSVPALLMLLGVAVSFLAPWLPEAIDPTASPAIWEKTAEAVVTIVLFATGLRIDRIPGRRHWIPVLRLLVIAMPLTIAAVGLLGWSLAGMTVAGAALLGAALAPTDPVLAGDVQVGPPLEGREHPVRFTLTAEAGLNDGLAFPFVYLGLLLAAQGPDATASLSGWLLWDLGYRVLVGVVLGACIGWLLGKILFAVPSWNTVARTGPGVVALGGVMLCYGLVETAEGYGFLGVFVAGLVCRRAEEEHEFHRRLHVFSESVEQAITAVLLVLLGSLLPGLWPALDWRHSVIGFGLLLVIRPAAGWLSLLGSGLDRHERAAVSFFGVRGIGSVYYVAYSTGHIELVNEEQIWALTGFVILASTVLHGAARHLASSRLSWM